jgi:hypothetical protein
MEPEEVVEVEPVAIDRHAVLSDGAVCYLVQWAGGEPPRWMPRLSVLQQFTLFPKLQELLRQYEAANPSLSVNSDVADAVGVAAAAGGALLPVDDGRVDEVDDAVDDGIPVSTPRAAATAVASTSGGGADVEAAAVSHRDSAGGEADAAIAASVPPVAAVEPPLPVDIARGLSSRCSIASSAASSRRADTSESAARRRMLLTPGSDAGSSYTEPDDDSAAAETVEARFSEPQLHLLRSVFQQHAQTTRMVSTPHLPIRTALALIQSDATMHRCEL